MFSVPENLSSTHVLVIKNGSDPFLLHKSTWAYMNEVGDLNGHVLYATEPPEISVFKQLKDVKKEMISNANEPVSENGLSTEEEQTEGTPVVAKRLRKTKNEG